MAIGTVELDRRFTTHPANTEQDNRMAEIRSACLELATVIDRDCPDSREKSDALTHLDYVMHQAVASITRREQP